MTIAFAAYQESFATALLDADQPVPNRVTSHTTRTPQRRFAVYRNNVIAGLVGALRTQFPATERIVGDEFFAAMARLYVVTEPPSSPILVEYGNRFPDFIAAFPPAAELPYLADVARLEVARTRAYHAADATPLEPSRWQKLDQTALHGAGIALHPSIQILRSSYPIVTIWSINSGDADLRSIEDCGAEDALVLRPHLDVQVRRLPVGGAAFLSALAFGASLSDAAISGAANHPDFNLTANLAGLVGAGLATAIDYSPIQRELAP